MWDPKKNSKMLVRKATLVDSKMVWEIRNNPLARKNFRNQEVIDFQQHAIWFKNKYFFNDENECYVIEFNNIIAGYCRFDTVINGLEVSIAVDPKYHGQGLGGVLLSSALGLIKTSKAIFSEIKIDNQPSLSLFQKNGFKIFDSNGESFYLKLIK